MRHPILFLLGMLIALSGCSITHRLQKNASRQLLNQPGLQHAYVGICVYDPAKKRYLYSHDADKYFTPASNTKLYTFYTGLSFIGDSTTGIQYQILNDTLYIRGTGDPSLLHPDFPVQPAFRFLQDAKLPIVLTNPVYENSIFGPGWTWDDYNADYQPERSAMPLYGNVAWFSARGDTLGVMPAWFARNHKLQLDTSLHTRSFYVRRERDSNVFRYNIHADPLPGAQQVPFIVAGGKTTASLLADTLHKPVYFEPGVTLKGSWNTVHNESLDSLFKHMLYRSDNFYAEQADQMSSMKLFDTISTRKVIHYMLRNKLKDLPDPPRWVDGSGLSRYNLFTPRDMVTVLQKLYQDFPHARIDSLLPTGGKGTLRSLYHNMVDSIFAKTGSLSNDVALSGYLITQKGHTLIFSILINHCVTPLQGARIAMQDFLTEVWKEY
jgi:D-alanyl-D-alanine carboxypeptidase/D-alanyl-D-alanine-endopeptidase (penicillin-binding protein 4)